MSRWLGYLSRALLAGLGVAAFAYILYLWQPVAIERPAAPPQARAPLAPQGEAGPSGSGSGESAGPIRIGWTAWTDAEVVTNLARRILEERLGYEVELVMADIGIQYQGVANGDLDLMLMAWLPVTHRNYWRRVVDDVINLGPIYTGARLGWAVPTYVPEDRLRSMADLAEPGTQRRIGRRIQGIDPGSGLMQVSESAMEAYGLENLELVSASGAAMTAALARSIRRREWIVVTAWSPHWMFAKWDLRYLEDPRGVLGGRERVHVLARKGFYQDYPPEVTDFLTRMYLPLKELEVALLTATEVSVERAVADYIARHPERIDYWVTGNLPQPADGASDAR